MNIYFMVCNYLEFDNELYITIIFKKLLFHFNSLGCLLQLTAFVS